MRYSNIGRTYWVDTNMMKVWLLCMRRHTIILLMSLNICHPHSQNHARMPEKKRVGHAIYGKMEK